MTDPATSLDIAALRAVEERGYERVINELRRIRTPRVYEIHQIAQKLTPAMGRDYHLMVCGATPAEYPVSTTGRIMLTLCLLPRLVASGVVETVREDNTIRFRFTLRVPEPPPIPESEDQSSFSLDAWHLPPAPSDRFPHGSDDSGR